MELIAPPEPVSIKEKAIMEHRKAGLEWDAFSLYTLSPAFLPKYLWKYWSRSLKDQEVNWRSFLKIMSAQKRNVREWVDGKMLWEELIEKTKESVRRFKAGIYPLAVF